MMFFAWFRNAIKNAVISGVQDALDHLDARVSELPAEEPKLQLSLNLPQIERKSGKGKSS